MSKLLVMSAGMLFEHEPSMLPKTTITGTDEFIQDAEVIEDRRRRVLLTSTEYADRLDAMYSAMCESCEDEAHISYEDVVRGLDDATGVRKKDDDSARRTVVAAALNYAKQPDVALRLVNDFMPDRFMDMLATAVHEVLEIDDVSGIGVETQREVAEKGGDRRSGFMALELDKDVQTADESCFITTHNQYERILGATVNMDRVLIWDDKSFDNPRIVGSKKYGPNASALFWMPVQGRASWATRPAGTIDVTRVPDSRAYNSLSPDVFFS